MSCISSVKLSLSDSLDLTAAVCTSVDLKFVEVSKVSNKMSIRIFRFVSKTHPNNRGGWTLSSPKDRNCSLSPGIRISCLKLSDMSTMVTLSCCEVMMATHVAMSMDLGTSVQVIHEIRICYLYCVSYVVIGTILRFSICMTFLKA